MCERRFVPVPGVIYQLGKLADDKSSRLNCISQSTTQATVQYKMRMPERLKTGSPINCHRIQPPEPDNFHLQEASSYCKCKQSLSWCGSPPRDRVQKTILKSWTPELFSTSPFLLWLVFSFVLVKFNA